MKHIEQRTYYESGETKEIFQTINDIRDGWHKYFHKNGELLAIINYKNGKQINQKIDSYDEQGNLIRTVSIVDQNLNGPFKEFYASGAIKVEGVYKNDNIIEKKVYDENQNLKYHYSKSNSKIKVNSLSDFKNQLKNILNFHYFDYFEIVVGIPKWSVYTPINVQGIYKEYKFNGIIKEICKWHNFESYYDDVNLFYKNLEKISVNSSDIDHPIPI